MRTLKLTKDSQKNILESLLKRSPNNYTEYESTVNEIINNVKENRDKAVFEYTKKFDKADVDASNIRVTEEEIKEAYELVDEKLLAVIKKALVNIRKYHEKQLLLMIFSDIYKSLFYNGKKLLINQLICFLYFFLCDTDI